MCEVLWRLFICSGIVGLKWFYGFMMVGDAVGRARVFKILVCFEEGHGMVNDIRRINGRCRFLGFRVLNRIRLSRDEVLDLLLSVKVMDGWFRRDPYLVKSGRLRS